MRGTLVVLLLSLAALAVNARADTITVAPFPPDSLHPTTLIVNGVSNAFPDGAFLREVLRSGDTITVEACYPFPAFSGLTNYQLTVPLGVLAVATYNVEYITARCDSNGNPIDSWQPMASLSFSVVSGSVTNVVPAPALDSFGFVLLVGFILIIGLRALTRLR